MTLSLNKVTLCLALCWDLLEMQQRPRLLGLAQWGSKVRIPKALLRLTLCWGKKRDLSHSCDSQPRSSLRGGVRKGSQEGFLVRGHQREYGETGDCRSRGLYQGFCTLRAPGRQGTDLEQDDRLHSKLPSGEPSQVRKD